MGKKSSLSRIASKRELIELQRYFAMMIRRPLKGYSTMPTDSQIGSMIEANSRSTPHQRLEFYAQQYWWRLIDSLDEDFPTVRKLLSAKAYEKLRITYLKKYPSTSFTIRNLGQRFPEFIRSYRCMSGANHNLISDAAVFDWAIVQAFSAEEREPISIELIEQGGIVRKKLLLQPHIQILQLAYPIDAIFKLREKTISEEASNIIAAKARPRKDKSAVKIVRSNTYLAIHRFNGYPHIKKLTLGQITILRAFRNGCSLSSLPRYTSSIKGVTDQEIINFFSELMALGWLSLAQNRLASSSRKHIAKSTTPRKKSQRKLHRDQ